MHEANSAMVFWDYCIERRACINNLTAKSNFKLHVSNAHTLMMQEEGDISNLCEFAWYEWCYFRDHTAAFPHQKEVLGHILGPAHGEGNEMCQWVLKANGKVMPRDTVQPLQTAEIHSPVQIKLHRDFDALIERIHGNAINPPKPVVDIKENLEGDDVNEGIEEEEDAIPDKSLLSIKTHTQWKLLSLSRQGTVCLNLCLHGGCPTPFEEGMPSFQQ